MAYLDCKRESYFWPEKNQPNKQTKKPTQQQTKLEAVQEKDKEKEKYTVAGWKGRWQLSDILLLGVGRCLSSAGRESEDDGGNEYFAMLFSQHYTFIRLKCPLLVVSDHHVYDYLSCLEYVNQV